VSDSMKNKTVLLTGANSGIGKVAALALAREGATLVMVSRDRGRGEAALNEVRAQSGNVKVELMLADLSVMAQVRRLADEYRRGHDRLHVLINNAGGMIGERRLTEDGYEATLAGNHLGPFLLTNLLLDLLKRSAPARVVNVASTAARRGRIDFDDLHFGRGYSQLKSYACSKLANLLFTRELTRRLDGTGVTSVAIHPGVVRTGFGETTSGFMHVLIKIGAPFLLSPERGADTLIWAATAAEAQALNGAYVVRRKVRTPPPLARDDELAKKLWDVSAELTKLESGSSG
jgi:NAD(P)-dependent dehydrogenase (short-subunit alcohol dehydrogenase family)